MKVLVVADIHANWAALSAINESYDLCLCLGDLVEYGTDPLPCIEWARTKAHVVIRGNHDHSLAQHVRPPEGKGLRQLAAATRIQHARVLQPIHYKYLSRLPVTRRLTIDGKTFHLVHATPRDPMDEYLGPDPDTWQVRLRGINADIVCVGHTHLPYELPVGETLVVNPGSVGQPRDGDPRGGYAIIENGRVELRRFEYDIEAAVRHLHAAGLDEASTQLAEYILRHGRRPPEPEPATPIAAAPAAEMGEGRS